MYAKIRVKLKSGNIAVLNAEIPEDIRDLNSDTVNDAVCDWLGENKVDYKWFRLIEPELYDVVSGYCPKCVYEKVNNKYYLVFECEKHKTGLSTAFKD